jgi:SAM-dependent methyltransferase
VRVKPWDEVYASPKSVPDMLRWGVTHIRLFDELIKHRSVLEVGTGTSMLSGLVSKWCDRVVTLDNSAAVLSSAGRFSARAGTRPHAVRGDAHRLPFPDGAFSACFSQGLLEHFDDGEVRSMVAEQLRVGAVVYASVPSVFYPHVGPIGPGLVGNERLLSRAHWLRVLRRPGWTAQGEYYADFKIASFAGRTVPWPAQILLRVTR